MPPHNQPGAFYGATTTGPSNGGPPFFGVATASPPARFFSPQPPANSPPARYFSPGSPPTTLITPPLYFSDQPPVAANAASPPLHFMAQPCASSSSPPLRYNFPPPPAVAAPPSRSPPPVLPTPEPPAAGGAAFSYFFPQRADSARSPVGSPAPYPVDPQFLANDNAGQPETVHSEVSQLPAVPASQSCADAAESSAPGSGTVTELGSLNTVGTVA